MGESVINVKKIARRYKMGTEIVHAIKDVSVEIKRGEYVALIGPSGSGKSTFMNIIGCLDTPSEGSYVLNGREVSRIAESDLAKVRNKEIGFIFQTFNLLPRSSALENVALPLVYAGISRKTRHQRAEATLQQVGLGDRVDHKPNELSGGQRQRVAIARALVNVPSILLADEPTGNLDSKTSLEIMRLFGHLHKQGNTIILVTHDPVVASYAHRVVTLKDGLILKGRSKRGHYPGCVMKIYTKTGDKGQTGLFGGKRVAKHHPRIEAYGTIDELNAYVGLLADQDINVSQPLRSQRLQQIQSQLFVIGAHLATPLKKSGLSLPELPDNATQALEEDIDQMSEATGPMRHFILPGGHPAISVGHVARCVCRRAERQIVALQTEEVVPEIVLIYVNRLSDYLFALCRAMAKSWA